MSDEKMAQELLQTVLLELPWFQSGSVVINDWSVRDRSRHLGPFAIIYNADDLDALLDSTCSTYRYNLKLQLLVFFTDWKESYDNFRDLRGEILKHLAENRELAENIAITAVGNAGVMRELYDPLIADEYVHNSLPIYIEQQMSVEVTIL